MDLPLYVVDAFTARVFGGNPAAVVPLPRWLPDATLLAIAQENNLSETAFYVPEGENFRLRWFTPVAEVNLCGHATLGTAHVLLRILRAPGPVKFDTMSGRLTVREVAGRLEMNLPVWPSEPKPEVTDALEEALGIRPREVRANRNVLVRVDDAAEVAALSPAMERLRQLDQGSGVIVTAKGKDCDFVSRFFAPSLGIPEDPVTGSAHCTLVPYWAAKLHKKEFYARQLSRRGGELWCALEGDRVTVAGDAVLSTEGVLHVTE